MWKDLESQRLWDVGVELLLLFGMWEDLESQRLWDVGDELLLFFACGRIWKANVFGM